MRLNLEPFTANYDDRSHCFLLLLIPLHSFSFSCIHLRLKLLSTEEQTFSVGFSKKAHTTPNARLRSSFVCQRFVKCSQALFTSLVFLALPIKLSLMIFNSSRYPQIETLILLLHVMTLAKKSVKKLLLNSVPAEKGRALKSKSSKPSKENTRN